MRTYKTKGFTRFVRREEITDDSLVAAIKRAEEGLIDADLGGGLIKQRIARQGKGRSGGYRTIIAYRGKGRAVFLFGFAKSERENISRDELAYLRVVAEKWLSADAVRIHKETEAGELEEIENDKEN